MTWAYKAAVSPIFKLPPLTLALDTTPDEFLTGSIRYDSDKWRDVAELMRGMNNRQLVLARSFLVWLTDQNL